jgi:hypothetical protein
MRRSAKVDANQSALVELWRAHGGSWCSLAPLGQGVPDGIAGLAGMDVLIEVKQPKGKVMPHQHAWHERWRGQPVRIWRTEADVAETAEHLRRMSRAVSAS